MDERVLLAARARREDAAIARSRERLQDGEQLLLRLARRIDYLREPLPELPAVIHARETKIFIGCLGERRDGLLLRALPRAVVHKIDTVVTHTAPSFCELQNKDGLLQWAIYDNSLLDDVQKERETMDAIYTKLRAVPETLTHWYYGHFHQSWHSSIDGVLFKMLDIMELAEITP